MHLVVTQAFAGHDVGSAITDPDEIETALAEHASQVVRVADPEPVEEPAPAEVAAPAPEPAPEDEHTAE